MGMAIRTRREVAQWVPRPSFEPHPLSTCHMVLGTEAAVGVTTHCLPLETTCGAYALVRYLEVLDKPQALIWGFCLTCV